MISVNHQLKSFEIKISDKDIYRFRYFGFDECLNLTLKLKKTLDRLLDEPLPPLPEDKASLEAYNYYKSLLETANKIGGELDITFTSGLTPQFIGNEYRKVQVIDRFNETRVFVVGLSSSHAPYHLELKHEKSFDGYRIYGAPFKSIKWLS